MIATPSWAAGIINHGSYAELERCLDSLRAQTHRPGTIRVLDTGVDPERYRVLADRERSDDLRFSTGPNRGYAGGANALLHAFAEEGDACPYLLLLNPDVELDPRFGEELVGALESAPRVALASGKLLRPGRRLIDSAGIALPRHRRPRDRGSEEPDRGQYDRPERVFAVSGAALMLRRAALDDLALAGEVFDEDFFLYHEDTDLGWRAHRLGWEVLYWPRATAVHHRGWRRDQRFDVPVEVRRHSFKNHYLQLIKNERGWDFVRHLPWIAAWEVLRLGYVLLRDPQMLPAYRQAWALLPSAWSKRRALARRAARV